MRTKKSTSDFKQVLNIRYESGSVKPSFTSVQWGFVNGVLPCNYYPVVY